MNRFPPHPSHSPAPDWLRAVVTDLRRCGDNDLADRMGVIVDLDTEQERRR